MKVVVAAGGRFHAFALAQQLAKRHALQALVTFSDTQADRTYLPAKALHHVRSCGLLESFFSRCRVRSFIDKSLCNCMLDNLFDYALTKELSGMPSFDLLVGWAHYIRHSMPVARQRGATIVLESGSSHILTQQAILRYAYERWQVPYEPIAESIARKMCTEYKEADYIMTLSSASYRSFLEHGIPARKLLRSTCGVDVPFFSVSDEQHNKRTSKGLQVLFVGLINVRKGIGELLEAWRMRPAPAGNLNLVGAMQRDGKMIVDRFGSLPGLRITGPVDRQRLRALYAQADVLVLPSLEDGFGMVIGEAMAAGCAVICSSNAGGSQLVKHGVTGLHVPAGDAHALAETFAWAAAHRDEIAAMGIAGRIAIADKTWDAYGDEVFAQYQTLLGGASHA